MCNMKQSDCSTTEGDCFGLTRFVRRVEIWGMIGLSASNMEKQGAGLIIRLLLEAKSYDANPSDNVETCNKGGEQVKRVVRRAASV